MSAPESPPARPEPAALGDDRFLPLKTITAFDCITLKVPAIWDAYCDEKGRWCCCRKGIDEPLEDDSGTLWIDHQAFDFPCLADRIWPALQGIAEDTLRDEQRAPGYGPGSGQVERLPDSILLRHAHRALSKGDPLVFNYWHVYSPAGPRCHLVHFSLVRTEPAAARKPWQDLVAMMDRGIRAAEIRLPDRSG